MSDEVKVAYYEVSIGGKTYESKNVGKFYTTSDLNQPDEARVTISNLHETDREQCRPGKELIIKAGYNKPGEVFKGTIFTAVPHFDVGKAWTIELTAYNKLYKLKEKPHSETYQQQTIQQMVQKVAGRHGLSANFGKEPPSKPECKWDHMHQASKSDFDFLQYLALLSNRVFYCVDDTLYFVRRETDKAPIAKLKYGTTGPDSLDSFTPDVTDANQLGSVTVAAWDYTASDDSAQSVRGKAQTKNSSLGQRDSKATANEHFILPVRNTGQAKLAAESLLERRQFEKSTAKGITGGSHKIKLAQVIELELGNPSKDGGKYYLSRVIHKFSNDTGLAELLGGEGMGGYRTIFEGKRDVDIG